MLISRASLIKTFLAITSSVIDDKGIVPSIDPTPSTTSMVEPPLNYQYHTPPASVNYDANPTVFGKILRGELPTSYTYKESETLLAFRDKRPRAPLHALVIPKQYIPSVKTLTPSDLPLLLEMKEMAFDVLQEQQPKAFKEKDYILCFHVPPFNSVDHLHLHVLAPASQMTFLKRYGKYLAGTKWCASLDYTIQSLKRNKVVAKESQTEETFLRSLYRYMSN